MVYFLIQLTEGAIKNQPLKHYSTPFFRMLPNTVRDVLMLHKGMTIVIQDGDQNGG